MTKYLPTNDFWRGSDAINKKIWKNFYHLGPKRDIQIFEKLKIKKLRLINVILYYALVYLIHEDDLEYYKKILKDYIKKITCTNPD